MFPTNLSGLLIILLFLVPGLITRTVISVSIPRREPSVQAWISEILLFSAIGFLIFAAFYGIAALLWSVPSPDLSSFPPKNPPLLIAIVIYIVFFMLIPIILGFAFTVALERELFTTFYRRLGVKAAHPIPRAWDYHFSGLHDSIVIATLKDGEKLAGCMGGASFASSYPANEDLFLELQLGIQDGILTGEIIPDSQGVWIQGSEISYVEFHALRRRQPMSNNQDDQNQRHERKVVETEETAQKGYRPSSSPIDPSTIIIPQPTRATPVLPEPPSTPAPAPPSSGNDTGDSGS